MLFTPYALSRSAMGVPAGSVDGSRDGLRDGDKKEDGGELSEPSGLGEDGGSGVVVGKIFPAILQNSSKLSVH
jgi:hypothetical protein